MTIFVTLKKSTLTSRLQFLEFFFSSFLIFFFRQYKFDRADIQTQRRRLFFFHFTAFVIGLHEIFERPYVFLSARITTVAAYLQSNYEREG